VSVAEVNRDRVARDASQGWLAKAPDYRRKAVVRDPRWLPSARVRTSRERPGVCGRGAGNHEEDARPLASEVEQGSGLVAWAMLCRTSLPCGQRCGMGG
jgi:hypothetical protein